MRVKFVADFDYKPSGLGNRVTIAYKAGMDLVVKKECGLAAVAAGKAVSEGSTAAANGDQSLGEGGRDGE